MRPRHRDAQRTPEELRQELKQLDQQLARTPNDIALLGLRGLLRSEVHHLKAALGDLNRAVKLCRSDEPIQGSLLAARALVRRRLGQYREAIQDLDRALKWGPVAGHLSERGECYRHLGQWDPALRDFDQSAALGPEDPFTFACRGHLHLDRGDIEKAIHDLNRAIALDPEYENGYYYRAQAFQVLGQAEAAEADFRRAAAAAERKLARDPDDAESLNWLAWVYADALQENLDQSVELAKRALSQTDDPLNQADYLDTLGWAYYKLGRLPEAQKLLERALTLKPEDVDLQRHLAEVRAAL